MIQVASYCRVSTDQSDQANSFEAQQRYFREYIQHHPDWELYEVYADEGITGTSTKKRGQFNRMINDAFAGKFSLIITKEVSRFSRNVLDTIFYTRELKAIGVAVLFVLDGIHTMNPDAEMYLSIMASIAQEESRKTSSRVTWGQTRQMERGVVFGHSMLGYDVKDGKITVNPEGAELVRLIFHKYANEQLGATEIARLLTKEGRRTGQGSTQWKSNTVVKILRNEKYVGDLVQKKTYTPDYLTHEKRKNTGQVPLITIQNHHEPIVSREVWNLAQLRLQANNKHKPSGSGHSNRYLFSGRIKCGECGAGFVGRSKYRKDGTKLRRWSCATAVRQGASGCGIGKIVRDDDALRMLKTALTNLKINRDAIIRNVTALAIDVISAGECLMGDDPERLTLEAEHIRKKREAVLDSYFSREISREDMQIMTQEYEAQIASLQSRIHRVNAQKAENPDLTSIKASIEDLLWDLLDGKKESELLYRTILGDITVFRDRHMELRLNRLSLVFRFTG